MDSWSATKLTGDVYRFTNVSGGQAVMVTMTPKGSTDVRPVTDGEIDPHTVSHPLADGGHFDRIVRGTGMVITWTIPNVGHRSWEFRT